jgi:hypothetical protein
MNEVKRYGNTWCEVTERTVFKHDQQDGDYVKLSDYTSLQEQLTATTNSLTNAQEALKSAGIEADTVQAGVMELKAQRDALAAENAALKGFGDKLNDMHNKLNGEGTGIQGRAEVGCQQVALEAAMDEFDTIKTPATDAYLNAVRAEGVDMFIGELSELFRSLKPGGKPCQAVKGIAMRATSFSAQLRSGNAGKDGV